MKHLFTLALIALPLASAADECRWSGGTYHGEEGTVHARFAVNADCTEITFESSGSAGIQAQDVPETFALSMEKHGWVADIHGVKATLAKTGSFVNFIGKGVNDRLQVAPAQ